MISEETSEAKCTRSFSSEYQGTTQKGRWPRALLERLFL
ncbi:hypothetical protein POREN0001_0357 [Porphyromonas endodontalis ATCC 35406]|uniref:Uncharacterized protein n=1 Tax=Porphyromonas endodontalis (strain ATCC 35406 / DSM 24491 / JCM 8526 / CCUG 16442 / BCRC 14492 / NCTC 13058 / HG 370) TaxID=553175 RepID=C3JAW5_POREA|nr:hypothetical protein POREN0001_0357 [Porphyromonas endodontalis ATCC 35406]